METELTKIVRDEDALAYFKAWPECGNQGAAPYSLHELDLLIGGWCQSCGKVVGKQRKFIQQLYKQYRKGKLPKDIIVREFFVVNGKLVGSLYNNRYYRF